MPECPHLTRKATSPCLLLSGSTRNVHDGIEGLPSFKQIQQEVKIKPFFKKIIHARIGPICVATLLIPAGIVGEIHEVPALQKFRSSIFKQKNDLQLGACLKSWKVKLVVSSSSTSKFENHSNPDLPAVQAHTVSASSEEVHLLYVRILLKPRIQTPRELVKSVGPLYHMQAFNNCATAQGIWTYTQVSPCVRCCKCQLRFNLGKPGQLSTVTVWKLKARK